MADNQTTSGTAAAAGKPAPAAASPVAEPAPEVHAIPTVDPQPILNVLDGLAEQHDQKPAGNTPAQHPTTDKPGDDGDTRKPLSDVAGCP